MNRLAVLAASSGFLIALTFLRLRRPVRRRPIATVDVILVTQKATVERSRHPRMVRKRSNDFKEKVLPKRIRIRIKSVPTRQGQREGRRRLEQVARPTLVQTASEARLWPVPMSCVVGPASSCRPG